jgi:hypothetical protein
MSYGLWVKGYELRDEQTSQSTNLTKHKPLSNFHFTIKKNTNFSVGVFFINIRIDLLKLIL